MTVKRILEKEGLRMVVILSLTLLIFGCKESSPLSPPNIVWIVSEDNSKHYLKLFDEHGTETPNIEALAKKGVTYTRAFSNGAVCSVARSAIISGCYGPRTGTQFHRKDQPVPLPDSLQMFPSYLREAGYYTVNNAKEDYNFIQNDGVWDESSSKASWRNRKEGQPFFYVHNIGVTHESRLHFPEEDLVSKPTDHSVEESFVLPNHPNTEIFRYTNARYRDLMERMDSLVGEVVSKLEADGLLENTLIFYYGDHGGVLPGSKGYLYETGLHVPMVMYVPEQYQYLVNQQIGSSSDQFVSFVDLAPTVLDLAGIKIPKQMDGTSILKTPKNVAFGYADRFDEKYDMARSVRSGDLKYIRNFVPYLPDGLMNNYRYKQLAYQDWVTAYKEGSLSKVQSTFFESKPAELLFDLRVDPYETNNLANHPEYKGELLRMRSLLFDWIKEMPDLSFFPEHILLEEAITNPVSFGQSHKREISKYLSIANIQLAQPEERLGKIKEALDASDPIEKYWALIGSCSMLGFSDEEMVSKIKEIASGQDDSYVRAQATLFLVISENLKPNAISQLLYEAESPMEALLILNMMTYLKDFKQVNVSIDLSKMNTKCRENNQVKRRLEYLG
ncbi:MAG: sulfatase [Cyclobacteriaceae bacterium]